MRGADCGFITDSVATMYWWQDGGMGGGVYTRMNPGGLRIVGYTLILLGSSRQNLFHIHCLQT